MKRKKKPSLRYGLPYRWWRAEPVIESGRYIVGVAITTMLMGGIVGLLTYAAVR